MGEDTVVYRERTHWALWVHVLLWGVLAAATLGTLKDASSPSAALGIVVVAAVLVTFVEGLTVLVKRNALWVGLGNARLFRKRVVYEDIESLESVTYHPLREFGGWGIRGFGKKQAWTARGDQAVVLHLVGERALYVGSDRPQRLEERIRATAGDRLGGRADIARSSS